MIASASPMAAGRAPGRRCPGAGCGGAPPAAWEHAQHAAMRRQAPGRAARDRYADVSLSDERHLVPLRVGQ